MLEKIYNVPANNPYQIGVVIHIKEVNYIEILDYSLELNQDYNK